MLFLNQIPFSLAAETRRVWNYGENPEAKTAPKIPEGELNPKKRDYQPGKIPPEVGPKAEALANKDPKKLNTERLTEALAKRTEELSLRELRTLATSEVGREKM
ncbi:MAG: hypothetical protein ACD_65C00048G0001, partial [uncultured bacterium]